MPSSWSSKDERQYEHIKESESERGVPEREAKEIAARTVNEHRREEGRTVNRRTQGTGNPDLALGERTRDELRNLAREKNLAGRSRMAKKELVSALEGRSAHGHVRARGLSD